MVGCAESAAVEASFAARAECREIELSTVYYLPGNGGRLETGLGEGLMERGWSIAGRETIGEFRSLRFRDQVAIVAEDLRDHFWREDARVVAVSFGAYLFLHAQSQLPPYVGSVLLLSPILGEVCDDATGMNFVPPMADRLRELAEGGRFPAPSRCHIHVGSEDWQSNPQNALTFGQRVGIGVTVVEGAGHQLGKAYVGPVLDTWLGS